MVKQAIPVFEVLTNTTFCCDKCMGMFAIHGEPEQSEYFCPHCGNTISVTLKADDDDPIPYLKHQAS